METTTTQRPPAAAAVGKYCPWGKIQTSTTIADGIAIVGTARHGGCKLNRERNAAMPAALRIDGGWYEEDCEIARCLLAFPDEFAAAGWRDAVADGERLLQSYAPHDWAAWSGNPVESLRGRSYAYDKECFERENGERWIVTAAWGDWHDDVPAGMVGVRATLGGARQLHGQPAPAERWFVVDAKDYAARGPHGYVIQDCDREHKSLN